MEKKKRTKATTHLPRDEEEEKLIWFEDGGVNDLFVWIVQT